MIKECKCPKCGEDIPNWWDNSEGINSCDNDLYYIDYPCHCKCGHKFIYTEWYKLSDTSFESEN